MLATVASLQKRQRPPLVVLQKALLSHLYPFYHYEDAPVEIDLGPNNVISAGDSGKENSRVYYGFKFEAISALKEYSQPLDYYDGTGSFEFGIEVIGTREIQYDEPLDYYDGAGSFEFNMTSVEVSFIDINPEFDYYDGTGDFEFNITKG